MQKVIGYASHAIVPHYEAIAALARQATAGPIDTPPWFCQQTLQWLWTMTTDTVSLFLIYPHQSKDAFFTLIEEWAGILAMSVGCIKPEASVAKPDCPILCAMLASCPKDAT